tara:strand:+ start:70 stop:582 length:513 start_codon:yes stop_codon:yes gene_type:complete
MDIYDKKPGYKRRNFKKKIIPTIKNFWFGWFGDLKFYKEPFKRISSKERSLVNYILYLSLLLLIPHWYLYSDWDEVLELIIGFIIGLFFSGVCVSIPFIAIEIGIRGFSFFYRIIFHQDLKFFDTQNKIYKNLDNLGSIIVITRIGYFIGWIYISISYHIALSFFIKWWK